jgi:hypothetical protein
MTYSGHVENGAIVLDQPVTLPDGVTVKIELVALEEKDAEAIPTLAERLACVIGKAEGLPLDWSENHDAYLRKAYGE